MTTTAPKTTTTIVLVGCASAKLDRPAEARELYVSDLFRKASAYAQAIAGPDGWFVLSAKHGLVSPDEVLNPYDVKLGDRQTGPAIHAWAKDTADQLLAELDRRGLHHSEVKLVLLAGSQYGTLLRYLGGVLLGNTETPLEGLGIGQRKSWLKAQLLDLDVEQLRREGLVETTPVVAPSPAAAELVEDLKATGERIAEHLGPVVAYGTALEELVDEERRLEERKVELVLEARAAGASWTSIGAQLGVSKQAAAKRFGPLEEAATREAIRADMAALKSS